ncbi:potassium transporter TrkA [candidate division Kazan bacterium]|uniref:Potassium transporter TrkA n=1 Tax=candidate division Kazan bacterium TaxID=2202143 RepID=A0A420ZC12_UNCK3|nr:MAG: potassium transporter TrkA [candidate division Kazan bacterium]
MDDKVCVIGLGEVGFPTAIYIMERGLEIWGYDIDPNVIERAKERKIRATTNWNEIPPMDTYVICVSTFIKEDETPDLSPIFDVCEKISQKATSSTLVSIESTIIPGTSKKIWKEIFNEDVKLVHVPHRFWRGDPVRYGVKQLRVIGAVNQESLDAGLKFYRDILGIPLHIVSSVEIAEMSKIAENAYRYVQIAFAEELRMICENLELDFEEVRRACNTKWNIKILEARDGIGGHCLPKDIRYLDYLAPSNTLLKAAILVDKQYREWLKTKFRVIR